MVDIETLTPIVARVLRIEDYTPGDPQRNYIVRYRGKLYADSASSYDRLVSDLKSFDVTPLFRKEGDQHVVMVGPGAINPRPSNPLINLLLFIVTLGSVIFAGTLYTYQGPIPEEFTELLLTLLRALPSGVPFAVSLLAILVAHEFGHYLAGRFHRTHVTLPYFIPFPFSPFGTMGAFIQLKEPPKNRRVLLDIGIAGPIAGLVVAIPVLLLGLSLSKITTIHLEPGQGLQLEGNSILYLAAKFVVFGRMLPSPASYGDVSPLFYWVRYFFTSQPLPFGGQDVMIHPIAWAGWAGLLVTALNLIPVGQLDGGHVVYTLIGKRARKIMPVILIALVLLGFVWSGWWLWAGLIFFLGRIFAEPLDQITELDTPRKAVAILGVIIFFLVFTPVPLVQAFSSQQEVSRHADLASISNVQPLEVQSDGYSLTNPFYKISPSLQDNQPIEYPIRKGMLPEQNRMTIAQPTRWEKIRP